MNKQVRSRLRPSFDELVKNYPDPRRVKLKPLKEIIGGGLTTDWAMNSIGDSCTLRMSRAFNYGSSYQIPAHFPGLRTLAGKDGLRYAYAVQEFHKWLKQRLGAPDLIVKGKPVSRDSFAGKKGIIIFDIVFGPNPDGTRALGHADLWDGQTFYDELDGTSRPDRDFFNIADSVSLWICPGTTNLASR